VSEPRPARPEDVHEVVRLSAAVFRPSGADLPALRERVAGRFERGLEKDADGAWVLDGESGLDGAALSVKREGIWVLTLLATHPAAQSGGVGGRLVRRAHAYGGDCHGFLTAASEDPRGWRLYHALGLRLLPCVAADGPIDRSRIPAVPQVREGDLDDLEACAGIDRDVRGGARVGDLAAILGAPDARLYRTDDGFAIAGDHRVSVLAARDERQAADLLWRVLADAGERIEVGWITAGQPWAVDTLLAARVKLQTDGPLFAGGRLGTLAPFIPNGALL
jgi:GNAT superfamily N-acetyltransferase